MCSPRFCARVRPSAVRVRIRSRSTSASPPNTAIISRPVLVPVSAHGSASERNCAFGVHDLLDDGEQVEGDREPWTTKVAFVYHLPTISFSLDRG
jgi:hypothetical protein